MVEATDELRERLAKALHEAQCGCPTWVVKDLEDTQYDDMAAALLPLVVAVVAEARTEAFKEAEQIADDAPGSLATGYYGSLVQSGYEEAQRHIGNTISAAALRGVGYEVQPDGSATFSAPLPRGVGNQKVGVTVDDLALDEMDGNQNAEPRWSANRLEEVLREGLPDQNAEPDWEWGYGHESESGLVPVLGFEGRYSEGRSREIAEKQMNDDLRWRYPLALMKRRKAGPWLPADQKGTEQ